MGNRDDEDTLCLNAIDDREREPTHEQATCSMQVQRPPLGVVGYLVHRAIKRCHEADSDCWIARAVSQPRISSFRFGRGMKLKLQCSALAHDALASFAPRNRLDLTRIDFAQALCDLRAPGGIMLSLIDLVILVETVEQLVDEACACLHRKAQHLVSELRGNHRHRSHSNPQRG
jgi:hypothetical protein